MGPHLIFQYNFSIKTSDGNLSHKNVWGSPVNSATFFVIPPVPVPAPAKTLAEEMIPGNAIELEVTESLFSEDNNHHTPILTALRKLGIKVAIDDFGTGYSSLQRLKSLPIDNVKIDKCFVDNIVDSPEDKAVVMALILLSKTFNVSLIAEGIETQAQADKLCELGCPNHQGYLYSKPLTAYEFEKWLIEFKQINTNNSLQQNNCK